MNKKQLANTVSFTEESLALIKSKDGCFYYLEHLL